MADQDKRILAIDIGVKKLSFVGNKIRSEKDREFLTKQMPDYNFLGFTPFTDTIIKADLEGLPPFDKDRESLDIVKEMIEKLYLEPIK